MKYRAFTLAETLVTLGLIGVIAAICFPIFKDMQPNNEMVMFKKAYYLAARTVNELINDEDFYPDAATVAGSGFSHVFIVDVASEEAKYKGVEAEGDGKFCILTALRFNLKEGYNCGERVALDNGGNFETTDGIVWSMPYGSFASGSDFIYVDVNGNDRGDNCGDSEEDGYSKCTDMQKPDRFPIQVFRDGSMSVTSPIGRTYLSTNKTTKSYQELK